MQLVFDNLTDAEKQNKVMWALWIAAAGPAALLFSVIGYAITGLASILIGFGKTLLYANYI